MSFGFQPVVPAVGGIPTYLASARIIPSASVSWLGGLSPVLTKYRPSKRPPKQIQTQITYVATCLSFVFDED